MLVGTRDGDAADVHALALERRRDVRRSRAGRESSRSRSAKSAFPDDGVRARDLRVQMLPVQVDMARTWMPSLPIGGVVTGTATVNGSTDTRARRRLATSIIATAARNRSSTATANVRLAGANVVRRRRRRAAGVARRSRDGSSRRRGCRHGDRAGAAHRDRSSDLRAAPIFDCLTADASSTRGTLDLASRDKGYDLDGVALHAQSAHDRRPRRRSRRCTAQVTSQRAAGFDPATMRVDDRRRSATSRWDSIGVDTVSVRANVDNGLVDVQRLYAAGSHTTATASGTFGLVRRAQTGKLKYRVAVDSLGAFNRWLPKAARRTTPVAPRPGVIARAIRRAKADSARIDRATEMERLINGRPAQSSRSTRQSRCRLIRSPVR